MEFDKAAYSPIDGATRQRQYRERHPDLNYSNRRRYRHNNSKWQTDVSYLARLFTAWDGEGITLDNGEHIYTMFAVKNERDSDYIYNVNGLGTSTIFEFILNFAERNNDTINVIYGGGYDFNMWLRDVPRIVVRRIYTRKFVKWNGYRIAWRKGKSFYIARLNPDGKTAFGVTIYDCAPFFQCPFVKACDDYLGDDFYRRDIVVANKALRNKFTADDVDQVREYNDIELVNLIRLMNELRARLNKVGLRPKRWDGPGAIASALLTREHIKTAKCESPEAVADAARQAYAGGRFEVIRFGSVAQPCYEYDVNSAYPAALRDVPNLARGTWVHHDTDPGDLPFALYHVRYVGERMDIPAPFYFRDSNGTICYPIAVTGWYWSPEVATGRRYCARDDLAGWMTVIEAWEFVPDDPDDKPFAFIDNLYNKRRALKKAGDGAHVGLKLGLNSLYGKLAQQVGAECVQGEWKLPPFHQIEWAGYTTSYCRSRVLEAAMTDIDSVIAFETDAVFSTRPLDVPIGNNLGDFEVVNFDSLTYVKSGMYFGTSGGAVIEKTRGIDRGGIHEADILEAFTKERAERIVTATLTRFIGAGVALAQSWDRWRRWEVQTKNIVCEPTGKRVHLRCHCRNEGELAVGVWHETICPDMRGEHSHPFPVLWANPNAAMAVLAELRDQPDEWDMYD